MKKRMMGLALFVALVMSAVPCWREKFSKNLPVGVP